MLIRLLTHRATARHGISVTVQYEGEEIDLPDEEAVRLIEDGQAEAVAQGERDRRTRRVMTPKETR